MSTANRVPRWIFPLLLPAAVLALFSPTLGYDFAPLDDDVNILFNPEHGPLTVDRVISSFGDPSYIRRYQPLGWILNSLVADFSRLSPWGYHATNVALHALNAFLLFGLLRSLIRRFMPNLPASWTEVAPGFAAAWWALHPLRVEIVSWVSGLPTNLSLAFILLALRLHLHGKAPRHVALASLAFAAALLSYPVGMGAAVLFPLLDWADGQRGRRWIMRTLPYLAVAVMIGCINLAARAQPGLEHAPLPTLAELPVITRVLRGFCFISHYWWKPWFPLELSPVYSELLHITWTSPYLLLGLVLGGGILWSAWRLPAIGLLLLGQFALLFPITGATELLHFPHDRYSLWADLMTAAGLALLLARWRSGLMTGVLACATAAGIWLTFRQLPVWHSTDSVIKSVRSHLTPGDAVAIRDVRPAFWLYREGRYDAAVALIEAELSVRPTDAALLTTRAQLHKMYSEHALATGAIGLTPAEVPPVASLHYALARQRLDRHDPESAAWHLAEIARLAPRYYAVLNQSRPEVKPRP